MRSVRAPGDPAGLGRGPVTRWLPVFWQAESAPPAVAAYSAPVGTRPGRFLLRVLFSVKRLTIPAAGLSILHQVGEALVPVVAGAAIDQALAAGDAARLVLWLGVLAVNFLVLSVAFRFSAQLTARATEVVQHRLRATLSAHALHPEQSSGRGPDGAVVSTMTNDVARIGMLGLVVFPVGEAAGVIFIAVSLLLIHPILGVAVLIGAPVAVWLMGALSGRYARASREYQTLLAGTVSRATDLVTGYRVIKGIRAEAEATKRYRAASRDTLDGAYRSVSALGRFLAGSDTIAGVFVAGVAALAAWFALAGELSVGGLIAAVGLAQALLAPLQMLTGNAVPLGAAAHASAARVLELLHQNRCEANAAEQETEAPASPSETTTVEVSVAADDHGSSLVRVGSGELVGVRADDRTASRIADAFLHPHRRIEGSSDEVRVRVDDTPAADLGNGAYRSRVVVAPHHAALFTGTIADNLATTGTAPDAWQQALHAAGCTDFLDTTSGLDGHVGEMGGRLSGGQRQRLALARALATDAPVLVLHEPTTAVDAVTEQAIATRLPEVRRGRTTILITSSPALLSVCDRIIDLPEESTS